MANLLHVAADLLTVEADCIVQQCNCVTVKAHGLSESMRMRFPYADVYSKRSAASANTARLKSRGVPGSVEICSPTEGCAGPHVACLMGQISPGKPGTWTMQYKIDPVLDTPQQRLTYFRSCLVNLREIIVNRGWRKVAFPYQIACGLAGGRWSDYLSAIEQFVATLPEEVDVLICKLP